MPALSEGSLVELLKLKFSDDPSWVLAETLKFMFGQELESDSAYNQRFTQIPSWPGNSLECANTRVQNCWHNACCVSAVPGNNGWLILSGGQCRNLEYWTFGKGKGVKCTMSCKWGQSRNCDLAWTSTDPAATVTDSKRQKQCRQVLVEVGWLCDRVHIQYTQYMSVCNVHAISANYQSKVHVLLTWPFSVSICLYCVAD